MKYLVLLVIRVALWGDYTDLQGKKFREWEASARKRTGYSRGSWPLNTAAAPIGALLFEYIFFALNTYSRRPQKYQQDDAQPHEALGQGRGLPKDALDEADHRVAGHGV